MIIDLPFYKNDGNGKQCLQVAMKTVLKHFMNLEFSLSHLDELTGRRGDFWTYTPQIVSALHDLGLDVEFYSNQLLEPFLEGESFI